MSRLFVFLFAWLVFSPTFSFAQTSDPQALALIAKSMAAMTGGTPVSAVTLNANAISILGSDYFTGTAVLQANGATASRADLSLNGSTRTEVRTVSNGMPSGYWVVASGTPQSYAPYNCWTDAAWFFPPLSAMSQTATPGFFFSYVGQEVRQGLSVQHIRAFQHFANATKGLSDVDRLSLMDIYLDSSSSLPLAVFFKAYSDKDMNLEIPLEIRFANYQAVNGIQVPFHIQRLLNGSLWLDLTVTSAVMSSTL